MTRIAIISDIHGNPVALSAVVADIGARDVDEVLVGGDLVGRGPFGHQIIDRIQHLGWRGVRGNHEDYLLSFWRRDVPEHWLVDSEWAASRWMAAHLEPHHVEFMRNLPFSLTADTAPTLRLFHGSPTSHRDGLGDWTPEATLKGHWDAIDEQILVCAHTHRPMVRRVADGLVVNVGSVGLPFNGDPRAQYGIFEYDGTDWEVTLVGVDYDRDAFLRTYETSGFLDKGDITAHLLRLEVRRARPFLVPFLTWCERTGRRPSMNHLDAFLGTYACEKPHA